MARAFIASVPMGVVLVAALVVPLAVIPGTFGFDSWPSSRGEQVTERQVRLAPPKVAVVRVRPRSAPSPRPALASVSTSANTRPAPVAVAYVAAPRRNAVVRAPAPTSKPDRGPGNAPSRPTHQQPQTQQQPQPQPQQPSKNGSSILAGGDPAVAREQPPADPTPTPAPPAPAPVEHAVPPPVERATPSEPCQGHGHGQGDGGGHQGDGDSQE